jgi:hypothetical protein
MPRPVKRQPRPISRTVLSVSIPIKPDWADASRAAGMVGQSLSAFTRDAVAERAARVFAGEVPSSPLKATG